MVLTFSPAKPWVLTYGSNRKKRTCNAIWSHLLLLLLLKHVLTVYLKQGSRAAARTEKPLQRSATFLDSPLYVIWISLTTDSL